MKTANVILVSLALGAAFVACDKNRDDDPTGNWTAAAPESVTATVDGAKSAMRTLSFDFKAPVNGEAGQFTMTADYDVTATAPSDSDSTAVTDIAYKATATINGTWTQDADDHDDYILAFDTNTLSVSGVDAPELGPVTDNFLGSLATFSAIEDVEVSKDATHMSFETAKPEVKYSFVKK